MAEEQVKKWRHCDEKKAAAFFGNPIIELQYKKANGKNSDEWRSTDGLTILNVKNKFFRYRFKTKDKNNADNDNK